MKITTTYSTLIIALCLVTLTACSNIQNTNPAPLTIEPVQIPLLGSWEITAIAWITKDTTYNIEEAQPGLLMINEDRYSIMWTPTQEPRVPFQILSKPTDEELQAGFRSVVFNAGTYASTDSTLTTLAQIAKVPGFEGGQQFYRYQLNGDDLELIMYDETYPDGTKPDWSGKVQTRFSLKRVE